MHLQSNSTGSTSERSYLDQLLDERAAADCLGYSCRALQNWRLRGGGPRFVQVSKRSVRYRRRDLVEWAEGLLRKSTSDRAST
jgi:hypothetical protein